MIAAAQRAQLRAPALLRTIGNLAGIGSRHRARFLAKLQISRHTIAVLHHPPCAALEHFVQIRKVQRNHSLGACARRHVAEKLVHKFTQFRRHFFAIERTSQQSHSAINVESHAARRHHSHANIRGCHSADRKSVTLMDIRHRQRPAHNSRQKRHVHCLLDGKILHDRIEQALVGVNQGVRSHTRLGRSRHQPAIAVQFPQLIFLNCHKFIKWDCEIARGE